MARVEVQYDGSLFQVTGWLPNGPAMFNIPRGGTVELFACNGAIEVVCRDRHGVSKPMRVEDQAAV